MSLQVEKFDGGINTIMDPGLLEPGVHQAIRNMFYLQDSDTLLPLPGKAEFVDSGSGDPIVGVLTVTYDDGSQYLAANDGSNINLWNASTGASVTAVASPDGTTLGAVQVDNRYFTYDGVNTPKMLLQSGAARQVGMTPITEQIAGLATASGSWLGIATGYFDYWVTEVKQLTSSDETADPDSPYELECAYAADPQTIKVENLNTRVAIRLPVDLVNTGATHFRVYRAGPKATEDSKEFPVGEQVVKDTPVSAAGSVVYDGSAVSETVALVSNTSDGVETQWTTPENVYGAGYAVQATSGVSRGLAKCSNIYTVDALTDAVKDPIVGLQVDVAWQLQVNVATATGSQRKAPGAIGIEVSFDNGTTWKRVADQGEDHRTAVNATGVYTFGGSEALWGMANLERTDFDPSTFKVKLVVSAVNGNTSSWPAKVAVDSVSVIVHFNGAGLTTYRQYNAIVVEALGVQTAISAAGAPPTCSVATEFEGAIVSNDIEHPGWIRYSQAGAVEYWPELYFLNFETAERDEVVALGTVSNKLIAGLRGAIYRVNYLPTEEDADGRRGLAVERLSRTHGILNSKCYCPFQGPDGRELLAFVSHNGVFATDGYSITKLSAQLNWRSIVWVGNTAHTTVKALINDPDLGILWLHTLNGTYALHYQGKLRWTGPHTFARSTVDVTSASVSKKPNGSHVMFLGYEDGTVYITDQYNYSTNPAGWLPVNDYMREIPSIETREIAPASPAGEGTLEYVSIYGGFRPTEVAATSHFNHWTITTGQSSATETLTTDADWAYMDPIRVDFSKTSGSRVSLAIEEDTLGTVRPLAELYLKWQEVKEGNLA